MTDAPLNRRQRAKLATRDKILTAARTAFAAQPYHDVTIRGVAKAAAMSTGAVFATVEDKEALWRACGLGDPPIDTPDRRRRLARQQRVLELIAGRDIWTEQTGIDFTTLAGWALTGSTTYEADAGTVLAYFEGYYRAAQAEGFEPGDPVELARAEITELEGAA